MTQHSTVTDLLAPHIQMIGDTPLTAGISVVSTTTAEGATITSTSRFGGGGEVESQCTYNDGAVTDAGFGEDVNNALLLIVDGLTAAIKSTDSTGVTQ